MPKMKTNKATAKRLKRTASGKYKRGSAFVRHKLTHKSQKRKRSLRKATLTHDAEKQRLKILLPYG